MSKPCIVVVRTNADGFIIEGVYLNDKEASDAIEALKAEIPEGGRSNIQYHEEYSTIHDSESN